MINQLFVKLPPNDIILDCLCAIGFDNLKDNSFISKNTMIHAKSVDIIKSMADKLREYYAPSKAKIYLENIDIRKCITIVRQLIKILGYDLISKEKMTSGRKVLYYRVVTINNKKQIKKRAKICVKPVIIDFD